MNSNNLEKLPPFMNWYAFEKKDQFSAVINFDHTSSLEITNDLISHSDKGQLSIKDIKSRRSLYLDFLKVHHKNISVAVFMTTGINKQSFVLHCDKMINMQKLKNLSYSGT